jgi:hypothetical protein
MAVADRDLLFGLTALQNGLISQGQLVAARRAWTLDKARALAEEVVARGDLDADDRSAVEAITERRMKKHGNDLERSLASSSADGSTRECLTSIGDPDINATLEHSGWIRRSVALTWTETGPELTRSARLPPTASGSKCFAHTPVADWAWSSWQSIPS